jgi:hypothetical protein
MSEKGPEADIEPRHTNVAEVPIPDIPVSVTISMQIGPVAGEGDLNSTCSPSLIVT